MSLFADYVRESGQMEIIERDWGFLTYEIIGEECWTGDGYVIPAERKSGKVRRLLEEMTVNAREKGCKFICARISMKSRLAQSALISHLRAGCYLTGMDLDYYYVKKAIEE